MENLVYIIVAAVLTAIITYVKQTRKYKPYYEGYKSLQKTIRDATEELGWKETYELFDKLDEMLEDDKVTNKEIKEVIAEADDIYEEIIKLYEKYYE